MISNYTKKRKTDNMAHPTIAFFPTALIATLKKGNCGCAFSLSPVLPTAGFSQVVEVASAIKGHWAGIVNWAENLITNGILEGFNSLFQAAKARGYRKTETIKAVICIFTRKLDFTRVNPFCATHTLL